MRRLRPLFPEREDRKKYEFGDGQIHEDSGVGAPYYVEGELEHCIVVSVPETTSNRAVNALQAQLEIQFKRTVLIFTHNIQFLAVDKLTAAEANAIIRQAEDSDAL